MKKVLLFFAAMLCGAAAHAADGDTFEYKGLNYMVTNEATHEVEVAKNPNATGDIEIPSQVVGPASTNYTVTSIATNAFASCELVSVKIPGSVTSIGMYAFYNCENLTKAEFASVESICNIKFENFLANPIYYTKSLWIDGKKISDLVIPNSVTAIGDCAFTCSDIVSVSIPSSVTSIGSNAFEYCKGLTSVYIPESVASISPSAFGKCEGLVKAEFASIESLCKIQFGNQDANPLYHAAHLWIGGKEIKNLVIPSTVTLIGDNSFAGCSNLISVVIPNSVTSIGGNAFLDCENLTKVEYGSIVALCNIRFGNFYANPLFYAGHLWIDGKEIKELVIPNSVNTIYAYTFSGCNSLISTEIPNTITKIGNYAFFHCENLASVVIPSDITSIGINAFRQCTQLTSVYYNTENPIEIYSTPFSDTPEDATLYVPGVAVEKCKTIQPWQSFKNIVAYDFSGIEETVADFDADAPCAVYNLGGVKVGNSIDNLPAGIYIVRQGNAAKKIAIK